MLLKYYSIKIYGSKAPLHWMQKSNYLEALAALPRKKEL
jgi:hypothetical protein